MSHSQIIDSLKITFKDIRRKIYIKKNQLRTHIFFRVKGWKFNLVLSEEYGKIVKAISRFVLFISLILSFFSLPFPYSIVISLFLILIEQLIERIIFSFVSIAIIPFPDSNLWNEANFSASYLGVHKYQSEPAIVGMFFENGISGKKVFEFIRGWNYNKDDDLGKGNITISFVIDEQKGKYAFFCYPSLNRPSIEKFRKNINRRKSSIGKEHITLISQMMICKLFNYSNSGLKLFRQYYTNGNQYYFSPFSGEHMNPKPIEGVSRIMKDNLKIVDRSKLTEKDLEKFLCDFSINWDDKSEVPNSLFSYK